jgi:hypothetical protein
MMVRKMKSKLDFIEDQYVLKNNQPSYMVEDKGDEISDYSRKVTPYLGLTSVDSVSRYLHWCIFLLD